MRMFYQQMKMIQNESPFEKIKKPQKVRYQDLLGYLMLRKDILRLFSKIRRK